MDFIVTSDITTALGLCWGQSASKLIFVFCLNQWMSCYFVAFSLWFHMAKFQANQNLSTKAMWELSLRSLVRNLVGLAGGERRICFSSGIAIQNGSSAKLAFLHNCGHRLGHIPSQNMQAEWHIWMHSKATSREQCVASLFAKKTCCLQSAEEEKGAHIEQILVHNNVTIIT